MSDLEESAAESLAESSGESIRAPKDTWPDEGTLAQLLESEVCLRRRARANGVITRWPSLQCTGVPSVKAMSLKLQNPGDSRGVVGADASSPLLHPDTAHAA